MENIFEKYFPLFNWQCYHNGILVIADPIDYLMQDHVDFFEKNHSKSETKTMEFNCYQKNYRIVATKSIFYR